MSLEAKQSYEDYIEQVMRKRHEEMQRYAGDMRTLVTSTVGESLFKIVETLISELKDQAVFEDSAKKRLILRGNIEALGSLYATIQSLAQQYVEPSPRGEVPDELFQGSGFTVGATFEEGT